MTKTATMKTAMIGMGIIMKTKEEMMKKLKKLTKKQAKILNETFKSVSFVAQEIQPNLEEYAYYTYLDWLDGDVTLKDKPYKDPADYVERAWGADSPFTKDLFKRIKKGEVR